APRTAIVSTKFAEKHWPGENPLGKRFGYGLGLNVKESDWLSVVGVVGPTVQGEYRRDMAEAPQTYIPYMQRSSRSLTIFTKAKSGGDATALAKIVRQVVHELDADQPVFWPQTLEEMV